MGYLKVEVGTVDHLQDQLGSFFDQHFDMVKALVPYLTTNLSPADLEEVGMGLDSLDEWLREMDAIMIDQVTGLRKLTNSLKEVEVLSKSEAEIESLESAGSFYFSELTDGEVA